MRHMFPEAASFAALIFIIGSCDLPGLGKSGFSVQRSGSEDTSSRHGLETGEGTAGSDTVLYVTGVEFPEGYCWQRDSSGESAECRIIVFRDGKEVLSVPAGGTANASSAPDMHRLVDGHLYTDCSTASGTVISCDGKELFRYDGREMICGFIVKDDGIYTLGQSRKGEGLSLRKNGEKIFSAEAGRVIGNMENSCCESGALYEDGGDMVFCYRNAAGTADSGYSSYYVVRNGVQEQLMPDRNIAEVYDIRYVGGVCHIAANLSGAKAAPVLYIGEKMVQLQIFAGYHFRMGNCRILVDGDDIFVKADYSDDFWETVSSRLWKSGGDYLSTGEYRRAVDFYLEDGVWAYAFTYGDGVINGLCSEDRDGRKTFTSPSGRYSMMGSSCAALKGGVFYAGLSPLSEGGYPVLMKGAVADTLKFNGYITSLRFSLPR